MANVRQARKWIYLILLVLPAFFWASAGAWPAAVSHSPDTLSPHNAFSSRNNPNSCSSCHSTHRSEASTLIRENTLPDTCLSCHNGTNHEAPMFPGSLNSVHSFGQDKATCNGCHLMHPPYRYEPLLRGPYTGELLERNRAITQNTSDYRLCLDCHRKNNPLAAPNIAQFYAAGTGHYIRRSSGDLPAGWQLSCSNCHNTHGTGNDALLKNPYSAGSMRQFCTSCHNSETLLYGLPMALPSTIQDHYTGSESCENCHGHVAGYSARERAQKAAHAPLIHLPAIALYSEDRITVDEAVYAKLEITAYYSGAHLSPPRNVPFQNLPLEIHVVYGEGSFARQEGSYEEPGFEPLESPQLLVTGAPDPAYIWLHLPAETIVRITSKGISREFLISP